jgi:hypothetical protein
MPWPLACGAHNYRLAMTASPFIRDLHAQIREGIAGAERGETVDLGSFARRRGIVSGPGDSQLTFQDFRYRLLTQALPCHRLAISETTGKERGS